MPAFRYLAPAGAPLHAVDLVHWGALAVSGEDVHARLRARACERFGVRHAMLAATGRAGMTLLLRAMRRLRPERDEVILPSYTCYSVAASAVKAGCRVRLVDVTPETLDYQHDQLATTDTRRVLAVVATNLYGLPNDLPRLRRFTDAADLWLIDDAAQAMDATIGGRRSGTWGDAGLFSFDKGKNVSAIDGGIVTTDSDALHEALEHERDALAPPPLMKSAVDIAKVLVYFALLHPRVYWIPNALPQLDLGTTRFDTSFPLEPPNRPLAALAAIAIGRVPELTQGRQAAAQQLEEGLRGAVGVLTIRPLPDTRPVYLRFPVLFANTAARDDAWARLRESGGGVSGSYPRSLADVPELHAHVANPACEASGGRYVASHILTLPTHAFAGATDRRRILDAVVDSARRSPVADRTAPSPGEALCVE